ncbi:Hint domain-containing protein [Aestuariibius sp. 2305UL40-4]|uniref:Hint domain-containing protein n=1 Tax=Aestuariibius violaceus TaxID=3234132 RepID=UPI00345EDD5C
MAEFLIAYVYAPSDFVTPPPDESGNTAQGNPPFTLELAPGAEPIQIVIDDDDGEFSEGDTNQVLAEPVTIDGTTYPAGTPVYLNYELSGDGVPSVYSITIGGTNTGNNTTTAIISTGPLEPGVEYTFTDEANIGNTNPQPYDQFICFAAGTRILCDSGERAIETLSAGDHVWTRDSGFTPISWIGGRTISGLGTMAPIRFSTGVVGNTRNLLVSPNHRMLITGYPAQILYGEDEVLVAAKALINGTTITQTPRPQITYHHMLFDRHEIVRANGAESESLFVGDQASLMLAPEQTEEILELFPELRWPGPLDLHLSRPTITVREGRALRGMI